MTGRVHVRALKHGGIAADPYATTDSHAVVEFDTAAQLDAATQLNISPNRRATPTVLGSADRALRTARAHRTMQNAPVAGSVRLAIGAAVSGVAGAGVAAFTAVLSPAIRIGGREPNAGSTDKDAADYEAGGGCITQSDRYGAVAAHCYTIATNRGLLETHGVERISVLLPAATILAVKDAHPTRMSIHLGP